MAKWILGVSLGVGMMASVAGAQQPAHTPTGDHGGGNLPTPMGALRDAQEVGQTVFKMIDANNDGQISQQEATDVATQVVGGFFFRADANGDGTLTADEVKQARDQLFQKRPWLRFIVQRAQSQEAGGNNANAANAVRGLGALLDANRDKQLQGAEVRQAIQTTVQSVFATADTDHNGQLSPVEVNAAMAGMARAAGQAAFQAADKDRNGQLSKDEFVQSLTGPAQTVFAVLDANGDSQLSPQEMESAQRVITAQLRNLAMPEAPNSPAHLIESGQRPSQAAQVPNIAVPGAARPDQAVQPAAAVQPAPVPAPAPAPAPAPVIPR